MICTPRRVMRPTDGVTERARLLRPEFFVTTSAMRRNVAAFTPVTRSTISGV